MSHDGKWLSFLAPVDGVLNVWVGPIDDPAAAKPVTHEKDRPIHSYEWAFTNRHILYEQDLKGDENFHVYAVEIPSGEAKDLTPRGADEQVRAEIEEISYKFPHELLIGLNDRDAAISRYLPGQYSRPATKSWCRRTTSSPASLPTRIFGSASLRNSSPTGAACC